MVGPFRFPESVRTPAGYSGVIQPVIVHAILDQKGKVLDAEVVQTSDPALASAALGVVALFLFARRAAEPSTAARGLHQCKIHSRVVG